MPDTFIEAWGTILTPNKLERVDDGVRGLMVDLDGEERMVAMNKYSLVPCRHSEVSSECGDIEKVRERTYMLPVTASNQMLNMDLKVLDGLG